MSEHVDVPADLPPELEARIQKVMDETGLTRDEVIERQIKAFFQEVDCPSSKAPVTAQAVRKAMKEFMSGG